MDLQVAIDLLCKWKEKMEINYELLSILNQPNGKHVLQSCHKILQHITFRTKNSVSQTNKHAKKMKLVIETVTAFTQLMEMKNYM